MFNAKGLSILYLWILTSLVSSKPIGICKTYFSILGIEGDAMNGQTLCSRREIPFVYFVLKCNDSNSVKCAKNLQWSALSVCDKANVHHDEIPVTTALNTVHTAELSIDLSLYIQTEDEVNAVDEFIIRTQVDPNDDNLKTVVKTVGRLHNTQLEVEFHRICTLPDTLRSPLQVISYILRNHPKSRKKRQAVSLEYTDQGLADVKPSISTYNGNPYLKDQFSLSQDDTELKSGSRNNLQTARKDFTTKTPFQQFWSSVAKQQSKDASSNPTATDSEPITFGLRNPYKTPAISLTTLRASQRLLAERSRSNVLEDFLNSLKPSSTTPPSRVTPRFISRSDVTESTRTTSPTSTTAGTTTSTTTSPPITSNKPETTTSATTTTLPTTEPAISTQSTSTTTSTPSPSTTSPTTASTYKTTTTPKPTPSTTTMKTTSTTFSTSTIKTTSTLSPTTSSIPPTTSTKPPTITSQTITTEKEQTTKAVTTEATELKPVTEQPQDKSTAQSVGNSTDNIVSTEASINTPLPSEETDTSASSSSSRMESNEGGEIDTSDDNFWPIVAAMVIGIPSVIVFAIAITVIHKKRLGRAPRFMSSSMYPSL